MLKAIIVDDEINGAESLRILLGRNCPQVSVLAVETDPMSAVDAIREHRPDILFLDIEMPRMNGFDVLAKLKDMSFHVIFTTAYDHYGVKAFRHNAIDYLLKPVIASELVAAVKKVKPNASEAALLQFDVEALLRQIAEPVTASSRIAISSQNEILYVDTANILRLEADSNYTNIILNDGKKIVASKTLKEYEVMLEDRNFFRVYKTYILNIKYIQRFVKSDGGYVVMSDGAQIPVSREKKQQLLELISFR